MKGEKKDRSRDRNMIFLLICLVFIAPYVLLVVMPGPKSFIIMAALIACAIGYELHRLTGQPCRIPNPMNMPGPGDFYPFFIALFSAGITVKMILLMLRRIGAHIILRRCIAFFGISAVVVFVAPADYLVSGLCIDLEKADSALLLPMLSPCASILNKLHGQHRKLRLSLDDVLISRFGFIVSDAEMAMADLFWLSDEQWAVMEPFMPRNQPGPERQDDRRIISGILYVLKAGCRWSDCPAAYGPPTTVYNRFNRWSVRGFWRGDAGGAGQGRMGG